MSNTVVFVAGGAWQKPFVAYLKSKGHTVAIVNPANTSTTAIADFHIVADVNDIDTINKHIEKLQPICITSDQSDISTMAVARLNERWKLPSNSVETVQKLTNKYMMYMFGKLIGMPVPATDLVSSPRDIMDFAHWHGFPIIVKPTDATMSRGFRRIDKPEEITDEVLANALKFSKSKTVIVQEFIPGDMVTLEGVCSGGRHRTVATSIKDGFFKPGINTGVRYPWHSPLAEQIVEANDRYVEGAGMKFGLTHSEYIINEKGFWLIEIGGRGGGAGIADKIVPWVSGVDTYEIFYQSLMGKVIPVRELNIRQRPALLKYYSESEVAGCDEEKAARILDIPGVTAFHYNFIGKQYVSDCYDSRHTMGIYLSDTEDGIRRIENEVMAVIQSHSISSIPVARSSAMS